MTRRFLPNCREASRLMSEGLDRELGTLERARLRLHLSMCDGCTNFRKQVTIMRDAVRRWSDRAD